METITLPDNFPIPRKKSVIVRQVAQGTIESEGGILLVGELGKNVEKPNIGIIYAVGSDVPDDLKPGMKVYYNHFADLEILVNGFPYGMFDEREVFCILGQNNFIVSQIKDDKQVRLEKKIPDQEAMYNRFEDKKANDKDKMMEINKKNRKK